MGKPNDSADTSEADDAVASLSLDVMSKMKFTKRDNVNEAPKPAESSKLKGDEFVGLSERKRMPNEKSKFVPLRKPGRPTPSVIPKQGLMSSTTYATMSAEEAKLLEPMDPKSAGWRKPIDPIKLREAAIAAPKVELQPIADVHSRATFAKGVHKSQIAANGDSDELSEQIQKLAKDSEKDKYRDDVHFTVKGLVPKLLPHQRVGVMFMMRRENHTDEQSGAHRLLSAREAESFKVNKIRGGLLCDDMGLGKTIQGLALILANPASKSAGAKCTLVIAPLSVLWQWVEEAELKAPTLKIGVHHLSASDRMKIKNPNELDVVFTTYDSVRSDASKGGLTATNEWYRVICDEGHVFRSSNTKLFSAVVNLKAANRWIFTGTPINNNTDDLFSYFRFLHLVEPEAGGWAAYSKKNNSVGNFVLRDAFQAVSMRRRQKILGNILPGCTRIRKEVELSPNERKLYEDLILRSKFESNPLVLLLKLRQICSDYRIISESRTATSNKPLEQVKTEPVGTRLEGKGLPSPDASADGFDISALTAELGGISLNTKSAVDKSSWGSKIRLLSDMVQAEPQRKTVVFSSFVETLKLCGSALKELGYNYRLYDGSMAAHKRTDALHDFREDESCVVLLCSLKASAVGLNITSASRVIIIEPWWNPMITDQAVNRVYRLGQKSHVDVIELGASLTVDTLIFRLQDSKRKLSDDIVEEKDDFTVTDAKAILEKALESLRR